MDGRADAIRGLTVRVDNEAGAADLTKELSLCPGARVYGYTIVVVVGEIDEVPLTVPDVGARILWQDSSIDVVMFGCRMVSLDAVLPGLFWADFARLVASPGCKVVLYVNYGNCGK